MKDFMITLISDYIDAKLNNPRVYRSPEACGSEYAVFTDNLDGFVVSSINGKWEIEEVVFSTEPPTSRGVQCIPVTN